MQSQIDIPPHKEVLALEAAAHMGFYEAPKETLKAIRKFTYKCFKGKGR
jgi:hypothetical protein